MKYVFKKQLHKKLVDIYLLRSFILILRTYLGAAYLLCCLANLLSYHSVIMVHQFKVFGKVDKIHYLFVLTKAY